MEKTGTHNSLMHYSQRLMKPNCIKQVLSKTGIKLKESKWENGIFQAFDMENFDDKGTFKKQTFWEDKDPVNHTLGVTYKTYVF